MLARFSVVALAIACAIGVAHAAAIVRIEQVAYPAYDQYKGIANYAPTAQSYAEATADRRFVMERLTYRSETLEVLAYLYRPASLPARRMPVVIFNRGSYTREDFAPEVLMPGRRLAEQGYLVIAPMYRGSGGANGHDEMGGAEIADLFNLVPVLQELRYADLDRLFLYGESRGGIMSLLAAKKGFPARATAVFGTIVDLSTFIGEGGPARGLAPKIWPGFPVNEAEIVAERSAIRWPEKINIPVLLMNGTDDELVSPLQALDLAAALERLGKPYELKIFHGEKHVIAGRAAERDADAIAWFRRFDAR